MEAARERDRAGSDPEEPVEVERAPRDPKIFVAEFDLVGGCGADGAGEHNRRGETREQQLAACTHGVRCPFGMTVAAAGRPVLDPRGPVAP